MALFHFNHRRAAKTLESFGHGRMPFAHLRKE